MTTHKNRIGDIDATGKLLSEEATFHWKIKDFFSLSDEIDCRYTSPFFRFSDMCLYWKLYPNGSNLYKSSGLLELYICREDSGAAKTFSYTFGIKSSDGLECERKEKIEFKPKDVVHGTSKFCSRSALKNWSSNLMPENVLTIEIVLKSIVPSVTKGVDEFLKSMRNLMNSAETADFTIKVKAKKFPVHTQILGARSEVFKSMFTHDMIEKNKGVVTIADCDPKVFGDFLEYVYTASTDISAMNVVGLYTVSDKYDVSSLKEECIEYMERTLTVATFCDVIRLALRHDEKELLKSATEFFCINSLAIVKTADWQTFLDENSKFGNELFIRVLSKSNQETS